MRVLVCDGQAKQALPVVRDLHEAGHDVWLASDSPWQAAACWSTACRRRRLYSSSSLIYIAQLNVFIESYDIDIVLPLKDVTTRLLAANAAALAPAKTCLAPPDTMNLASHKGRIGELARDMGVAVPATVTCPADAPLPAALKSLRMPVVVKAAQGSGAVRYANSPAELERVAHTMAAAHGELVVQEYIRGEGVGFFALYDRGRCVVWYTHCRRREYPATGGISISAESTRDGPLAELGRALMDRLKWHGPAMVECKREAGTGRLVLLEVNTKFWGSLDLALACGLTFPQWTVALAAGAPVEPPEAYPVGVKVCWPAPAALAQACTSWQAAKALMADLCDPEVRSDWRWSDPIPHLIQVAQVPGLLWQTRGRWRAPHGRPLVQEA